MTKAANLAAAGSSFSADANGNVTIAGASTASFASVNSSYLAGNRNRIINGNMYIAQRATSATVTAGTAVPTASAGYPCVDRFFVYSTGANVTAAQVTGSGPNRNLLRITGAASVTAVGIGQRIESLNSFDLAGRTCTLSAEIANSVLTTVTWTVSYANTTDTFGTIGTPTKTQIATGTFTVNSTLTRYSANVTIPLAATTGIEVLFTVGSQTSGTWDIDNVQFEPGSVATPFEQRLYSSELASCQRYCETVFATGAGSDKDIGLGFGNGGGANFQATVFWKVQKRAAPSLTIAAASNFYVHVPGIFRVTCSALSAGDVSEWAVHLNGTSSSNTLSSGQGCFLAAVPSTTVITASSEL